MTADPEGTEVPVRDGMMRNAGFAFTVTMVSAAGTAVMTLFLLRSLGPKSYGVFALALGLGSLILIPSNLGISSAASRFVAELRHDRAAVRGVVIDAFRLKLVVSTLFAVGLMALAGPIAAAYDTEALVWPIRILSLAVLGQSVLQLYDELLEAEGKVSVYLRVIGAESLIETTASIALVLAGFGVSGAMAGRAGAYLFAAIVGGFLLFRHLGFRPELTGRGHGNVRRIAGYGSMLLIIDGTFTLFSQIDVLLIGAVLGVTAVGQFEAPMRLVNFLGFAGGAISSGVAPRVARGLDEPDTEAFDRALRRLMAFQGLFVAPLLVWAEPLARLVLGPDYSDSAAVMRGLSVYVFMLGLAPLLSRGVTYMGEARRRIPIAIVALLINAGTDLVLLPRVGVVGGAIGTDVGYFIYVSAHLWICRRLIGTALRPLGVALSRVLVAVAVVSGMLFALGTGEVALPVLLLGGVLSVVVYAATLRVLGELSASDVAAGRKRARALGSGFARRVRSGGG